MLKKVFISNILSKKVQVIRGQLNNANFNCFEKYSNCYDPMKAQKSRKY